MDPLLTHGRSSRKWASSFGAGLGDVEPVLLLFCILLICRFFEILSQARDHVLRSLGVQRARAITRGYADKANEVL